MYCLGRGWTTTNSTKSRGAICPDQAKPGIWNARKHRAVCKITRARNAPFTRKLPPVERSHSPSSSAPLVSLFFIFSSLCCASLKYPLPPVSHAFSGQGFWWCVSVSHSSLRLHRSLPALRILGFLAKSQQSIPRIHLSSVVSIPRLLLCGRRA